MESTRLSSVVGPTRIKWTIVNGLDMLVSIG